MKMNKEVKNYKLTKHKKKYQNPPFVYAFRLNKIELWMSGTWPIEKEGIFKDAKFVIAIISQVIYSPSNWKPIGPIQKSCYLIGFQ